MRIFDWKVEKNMAKNLEGWKKLRTFASLLEIKPLPEVPCKGNWKVKSDRLTKVIG